VIFYRALCILDNIKIEMLDYLSSGNKVAILWKYTADAVEKSKYSTIDLTGNKVELNGMDMFYISGTKTEKDFASWDNLKMAQGAGYKIFKEGTYYRRVTTYEFNPLKFDDMISYGNGLKEDVQKIEGLNFEKLWGV